MVSIVATSPNHANMLAGTDRSAAAVIEALLIVSRHRKITSGDPRLYDKPAARAAIDHRVRLRRTTSRHKGASILSRTCIDASSLAPFYRSDTEDIRSLTHAPWARKSRSQQQRLPYASNGVPPLRVRHGPRTIGVESVSEGVHSSASAAGHSRQHDEELWRQ